MVDNLSKLDISNQNKIIKISYNNCLYWVKFIQKIQQELVKNGVILIKKVPEAKNKSFLKKLTLSLGKTSWGGDKRPKTQARRQIDQMVIKKDRSAIDKCWETVEKLMALNRNKLPDYLRGMRAMTLIISAL